MEPIKQYLINSITLDGYTDENGNEYNEANMTDGEKITAAKRNFESEMGWLIERSARTISAKTISHTWQLSCYNFSTNRRTSDERTEKN